MSYRALLFSKAPDFNAVLSEACHKAGIILEPCDDIFLAIEKGTKQSFSCAIVDWSEQPEAGFLLKRIRESAQNTAAVAIAFVEHDPSTAEMRDHRLDFLIYRPIEPKETADVLKKAAEKMPEVKLPASARQTAPPEAETPSIPSAPSPFQDAQQSRKSQAADPAHASEPPMDLDTTDLETTDFQNEESAEDFPPPTPRLQWKSALAAALALAAAFCLWSARDTISYLASSPGNRSRIFKDSLSALFFLSSGNTPSGSAPTDVPVDTYVSRSSGQSDSHLRLGVVDSETNVTTSSVPLRQAPDFPLPTASYEPPPPPPNPFHRGTVPDSLRGSPQMPPPVVVTTQAPTPASAPAVIPVNTQQFNEPVAVSEEAARALLVHSVAPVYPSEAAAQKLHGPVILQATIGRDGAVEDLKILRGSFVLSKAAIAAVKHWRFQPYTINGHPAEIQTLLTINFSAS